VHPLRLVPDGDGGERRGDDDGLLDRIADGDRAAFDAVYRRYYRPLFSFLMRMVGDPEATEELVDDTLLVVWQRADSFAGRSRPSTWIFGIAHRKGLKHLEKRGRRPHRSPLEESAEPVAPGDTPERTWDRRELANVVGAALTRLSVEQRTVVVLAYHQGLSYPEISQIVGCPLGTVKTRMFHARRKLARLLPHYGFSGEGELSGEGEENDQ